MREVVTLPTFATWLADLKDGAAKVAIIRRIERMRAGNFGDVAPVGNGISEARLHVGPGYRLYFAQVGTVIVVLLCGGTKRDQTTDIARAKRLWQEFRR